MGKSVGFDFGATNNREAEPGIIAEILPAIKRAANTDMHTRGEVDNAFFGGAPKRSSVGYGCAKVGVPSVEVGIEMEHGHWAMFSRRYAKEWQCNGVVSADGDEPASPGCQLCRALADLANSLFDVEGVCHYIAGISNLLLAEGFDILRRVVWPQESGCFAHLGWTEPGTRSKTYAAVERNPDDRNVGCRHLIQARKAGEGRKA